MFGEITIFGKGGPGMPGSVWTDLGCHSAFFRQSAKYCNFSEQLICEAFGHSSVKVTETYLKNFKNEEIKKANDAIILYVSNNGKKRV